MAYGIIQTIVLVLCFILLLIGITLASGKKIKALQNLVIHGIKKEFFTKPGWISLMTIIIVAAVSLVFALCSDLLNVFIIILGVDKDIVHFPFSMALFFIIVTLLLNFLFIGMMYHMPRKLDKD